MLKAVSASKLDLFLSASLLQPNEVANTMCGYMVLRQEVRPQKTDSHDWIKKICLFNPITVQLLTFNASLEYLVQFFACFDSHELKWLFQTVVLCIQHSD